MEEASVASIERLLYTRVPLLGKLVDPLSTELRNVSGFNDVVAYLGVFANGAC